MAKQRPSVLKRQREHQKRQRELKKAEKAAQKRERRLLRDQQVSEARPEDAVLAPDPGSDETGPAK
jgi:hypothetical protein